MLYYTHSMSDKVKQFFLTPTDRKQILYEALRKSFIENLKDKKVCELFKINFNTFRSLKRDFVNAVKNNSEPAKIFFIESKVGKRDRIEPDLVKKVISLRLNNLSIPDIKAILSTEGIRLSFWKIDKILKVNNFSVLPRRTQSLKQQIIVPDSFKSHESYLLEFPLTDKFESLNGSIILFYPIIKRLNIEKLVEDAGYPGTARIPSLNAILSFLALKLLNSKRLSHSNDYSLDRGLGLFAGLNVLPKNAWFASYSYRVNREMNKRFLNSLNKEIDKHFVSSGDFNLDFTTIPHWGDESVLERNWSGKRRAGLKSVLALIVQDQENRFLKYGDAEIKHNRQSDTIIEFIDFYRAGGGVINCLIFDSKFTTYRNLDQLNKDNIKFLTLRRRSKKLIGGLGQIEKERWQKIHLNKKYKRKHRNLLVYDSTTKLKDYEGNIRQIAIKNNGHDQPTFIITNDTDISTHKVVLKYAKRWLVEQAISEQIEFYNLNRLNSSIVVKVDFDLTMSIFANTIYKIFSSEIPGFNNCKAEKIHRLFINNFAYFSVSNLLGTLKEERQNEIEVTLNKKVHLPLLYETDWFNKETHIKWLHNYKLKFKIGTSL